MNNRKKKDSLKRSNNFDESTAIPLYTDDSHSPPQWWTIRKKAIRFLKFNEMFIIKHYIVVLGVQQQWRRVSSINLKNNNNGIGFPSLRRLIR